MALPMTSFRARRAQRGFSYLGLLFALALVGMSLAMAGTVGSFEQRRQREQQLIWVGQQYVAAIAHYYASAPTGLREYPRELADLLEDKRGPVMLRHLRRIYVDPETGQADWELLRLADGALIGVASASQQQPIKRAGFDVANAALTNAECYCDWHFVYLPQLQGSPLR
jgi:type II secretory pathway pseudopilin PulG